MSKSSILLALAASIIVAGSAYAISAPEAPMEPRDATLSAPDLPVKIQILNSKVDKHPLSMSIIAPEGRPKAIVCISHGMAEHKERYFPFMQYLAKNGYVCEAHDHRGHGGSITQKAGLGDFGTNKYRAISDDLQQMVTYMQEQYPGIPTYLFCHSMGTMVGRMYLQDYDTSVDKVVLCGPPSGNGRRRGAFKAWWRNLWHPHRTPDTEAFAHMDNGGPKNNWLSVNPDNVAAYNADPLCGFSFTYNGSYNSGKMSRAIAKKNWEIDNPSLPIWLIAGENDPAIGSPERFNQLVDFVKSQGYTTVSSKLYAGLRHELLNEIDKEDIWADVKAFYDK